MELSRIMGKKSCLVSGCKDRGSSVTGNEAGKVGWRHMVLDTGLDTRCFAMVVFVIWLSIGDIVGI